MAPVKFVMVSVPGPAKRSYTLTAPARMPPEPTEMALPSVPFTLSETPEFNQVVWKPFVLTV